jgi:hypothetical protein
MSNVRLELSSSASEELIKLLSKQTAGTETSGDADSVVVPTGCAVFGYHILSSSNENGFTINISQVKERRALSERSAKITKTVNNGELMVGLGSVFSGMYTWLAKGDKSGALPLLWAGGIGVFDCLKSWVIDWLKIPAAGPAVA